MIHRYGAGSVISRLTSPHTAVGPPGGKGPPAKAQKWAPPHSSSIYRTTDTEDKELPSPPTVHCARQPMEEDWAALPADVLRLVFSQMLAGDGELPATEAHRRWVASRLCCRHWAEVRTGAPSW